MSSSSSLPCTQSLRLPITSLGPVVNILAIFSNANILKDTRIQIYHIKGVGCPLLFSFMSFLTKERKNKKRGKIDQTGTQTNRLPVSFQLLAYIFNQIGKSDDPGQMASSETTLSVYTVFFVFFLHIYTGKCIRRFGGIYANCRYFIDRKW